MSSLNLLNLIRDKNYYTRYNKFINVNALNKEERQVLKDVGKWFETAVEDVIDWNSFRGWFFSVAHPRMGEVNSNIYNQIFDKLDEYDEPDESFATATIEAFLLREMCGKVSELTLACYEGSKNVDIDDIQTLLDDYSTTLGRTSKVESFYVNDDIEQLTEDVTTGGLEWRHEQLNKSVGNLRKGKLVIFGARPNQGKTTFLLDNVTHMASQLEDDEVVLWFNNEEAGKEVKFRMVQSAIAKPSHYIRANPIKAKGEYVSAVGDWNKIIVVDKADLSVHDVEAVLKQHNAGLVVFDQLWKVHGFESEAGTDAQRLQILYQWAREQAKQHAPVISSHQADYTAEGETELTMGQLHMNKTGIQGECDTIIMMGRSYEVGEERFRHFTVCKNKGAYGPRVDSSLVEHKYVMEIDNEVARYED